jgi:hypothetical protein
MMSKVAHKVCHIDFFHYLYALKKRVPVRGTGCVWRFCRRVGKGIKKIGIFETF